MNLNPDTSIALMQAAQGDTASRLNDVNRMAKTGKAEKDAAQLEAAAQDFEAMFVTEMMKPMFEQIKPDERFGGGKGEEIFRGLMLQEYGKMMAETGQLGIADSVKQELIRMQEEAKNPQQKNLGGLDNDSALAMKETK